MDPITVAFAHGLGDFLFPIKPGSKIPDCKWSEFAPPTEGEVRGWLTFGLNIGFRCGSASGVMVIDDDRPKHPGNTNTFVLPSSGFSVRSPTGSVHWYFKHAEGVRNSAGSRLGEYIDVRGEGGYVVFAGSTHEDGGTYEIASDGEISDCPEAVTDRLLAAIREFTDRPSYTPREGEVPSSDRARARGLLRARSERLAATAEGGRNQAMFDTALYIGGFVGSGELDVDEADEAISCAADACGLEPDEIDRTVRRALVLGADRPLSVVDLPGSQGVKSVNIVSSHLRRKVYVPGTHTKLDGSYHSQENHTFSDEVIEALPGGALYRRDTTLGRIHDGQFLVVDPDDLRCIVSEGVHLIKGSLPKTNAADPSKEPIPVEVDRQCTRDQAGLLRARASASPAVRQLVAISTHPVYLGVDLELSRPGWNAGHGVYQAYEHAVDPLPLGEAVALIDEMLCDFVWGDDCSKANYIGLLLTPIMRHAIEGYVPMHLLEAADIGAGKSLLASDVLGGILLGKPVPADGLGATNEESEKRITGWALQARALVNFDNVSGKLDHESLARLVTGHEFGGRLLGSTKNVEAPNRMTVVATGNAVRHNSDLGRRIVHILRQPTVTPYSELKHPGLAQWVLDNRERLLGALLGLVEHWKNSGTPPGPVRFDSFEGWARTVGGIMACAGWAEHLDNIVIQRDAGDLERIERQAFVEAWWKKLKDKPTTPSALLALADAEELFQGRTDRPTDRGRGNCWSRILTELAGNVISGHEVISDGVGRNRRLRLN